MNDIQENNDNGLLQPSDELPETIDKAESVDPAGINSGSSSEVPAPSAEPAAESTSSSEDPAPASEPIAELAANPAAEPATAPASEPAAEPDLEPAAEPGSEIPHTFQDADPADVNDGKTETPPAPVTPVFGKMGPFRSIIAAILVVGLAGFTVLVEQVRRNKEFQLATTSEIVTAGLQVVIYVVLFVIGWKLIDRFDKKAILAEAGAGAPKKHLLFCWNARSVILTAVLLFGMFVPYLLVFYPGVASMDTVNQIKDFTTGTMPIEINWNAGEPMISCFLNDHHPVVDTFVFTFFTEFVGPLLGGPVRGAFVYCALQAALTALFMALVLCRMEKFGIPYAYRKAGFLFLGFAPFIGLYVIGMLKDSIYSMFFIAYYLLYVVIVLEGATNRRMVGVTILAVVLALTKKTGVYLVLISNLALVFVPSVRRKWAEWAASWVLPALIVLVLLPHVVFPMCNIFVGGRQESIGFTMQMTARTYLDHKDELTPQEVQTIGAVIDLSKVEESYSSYNYDEIKKLFNYEATDEQVSAYKQLWLQLFMRYPLSGLKALFGTGGGFFTPTESIRVYYKFPTSEYVKIPNPPKLAPYREAVEAVYRWLTGLPGIGLLFQCVLYCWWLPLAVLLRVLLLPDFKGRRLKCLGCLVPIAVCVLILWVSPYAMGRYGLSQYYTLPLVMGLGSRLR